MYNTNTSSRGIRHGNNPNAATAVPPGGMTYGQSAASGPAPTTAGHHKHDVLNKMDPRVDNTHDRQPMVQASSGIPEGTYGPHSSRLANALDPRVDSDLDSTRAGAGQGAGGGLAGRSQPAAGYGSGYGSGYGHEYGHGHGYGGPAAPPAGAGAGAGAGVTAPHTTAGPHRSDLMNKLDPRVDSATGAWKGGTGSRGSY
ncbi:hypothetical protein VTH06DRAFT_5303 [Thermothelomyces fergusii]